MKLDDNIMTTMVDAAAKAAYGRAHQVSVEILGDLVGALQWDELPPLEKNRWRQSVLLIVWDAVEAMPDIRYAVWLEGYLAGDPATVDGSSEPITQAENPYPAPEVPS